MLLASAISALFSGCSASQVSQKWRTLSSVGWNIQDWKYSSMVKSFTEKSEYFISCLVSRILDKRADGLLSHHFILLFLKIGERLKDWKIERLEDWKIGRFYGMAWWQLSLGRGRVWVRAQNYRNATVRAPVNIIAFLSCCLKQSIAFAIIL